MEQTCTEDEITNIFIYLIDWIYILPFAQAHTVVQSAISTQAHTGRAQVTEGFKCKDRHTELDLEILRLPMMGAVSHSILHKV